MAKFKINIALNKKLVEKLTKRALKNHRSRCAEIEYLLEKACERKPKEED